MLDKEQFLREYNIEEIEFEEADISWEELEAIYEDYEKREDKLDVYKRQSLLLPGRDYG